MQRLRTIHLLVTDLDNLTELRSMIERLRIITRKLDFSVSNQYNAYGGENGVFGRHLILNGYDAPEATAEDLADFLNLQFSRSGYAAKVVR